MVKKIFIGVLILIVLLVVFKDRVIKTAITTVGSKVVGVKLEVEKFSFKILSQKIHIEGFKLYNPEGFPDEPLLFINQVEVDYDLASILKGKIHCPLVVLDIREVVVVKNKEEVLNVDEIPIVKNQPQEEPSEKEEAPAQTNQEMDFQIDLLKLNVSKVIYTDFTKGNDPKIEAFDVGLKDKEYQNITSPNQLIGTVMYGALKGTAIKGVKLYGMASIASLVGVGFLPAGVATVLVSKDHAIEEYDHPIDAVFNASVLLFEAKGRIDSKDQAEGIVKGKLEGCDVAIKLEKVEENKTKITVSARKMLLPKPKIAGGIIHQISLILEQ